MRQRFVGVPSCGLNVTSLLPFSPRIRAYSIYARSNRTAKSPFPTPSSPRKQEAAVAVGRLSYDMIFIIILLWCNVWQFLCVKDDKRKAERHEYRTRTPELYLLCGAFVGGSGGLLALICCNHKTSETKRYFMWRYICCTLVGLIVQCFLGQVLGYRCIANAAGLFY